MKKIDKETMEQFAKEKNIDKNKIEEIANGYKGKSEDELMSELIKIGKTLKGKDEVVDKIKTFLDENQRKKIDTIMSKIYAAEAEDKVNSKKSKKTKSSNQTPKNSKHLNNSESKKKSKSNKTNNESSSGKKLKKVIKRV